MFNNDEDEKPEIRSILPLFDASPKVEKEYSQRMFGWFKAPQSGPYVFFTSCGDSCELYMSKDDGAANKQRIVSQFNPSAHNQFDL